MNYTILQKLVIIIVVDRNVSRQTDRQTDVTLASWFPKIRIFPVRRRRVCAVISLARNVVRSNQMNPIGTIQRARRPVDVAIRTAIGHQGVRSVREFKVGRIAGQGCN